MFEGISTHERELDVEKIREQAFAEFCHTSVAGYQNFKARAAKNKGHIRISVHPFFAERFPATTKSMIPQDQLPDALAHMREGFGRTVTSVTNRPDSSPLIVFEETRGLTETDTFISQTTAEQQTEATNDILVIETQNGTGALSDETIAQFFTTLYPDIQPNYTEVVQNYSELQQKKYQRSKERLQKLNGEDWLRPITNEERKTYLQELKDATLLDEPLNQYKSLLDSYRTMFIKDFVADAGIKSMLALGSYIDGEHNKTYLCLGMIVQDFRSMGIPVDISRYVLPSKDKLKVTGVPVKETNREIENAKPVSK